MMVVLLQSKTSFSAWSVILLQSKLTSFIYDGCSATEQNRVLCMMVILLQRKLRGFTYGGCFATEQNDFCFDGCFGKLCRLKNIPFFLFLVSSIIDHFCVCYFYYVLYVSMESWLDGDMLVFVLCIYENESYTICRIDLISMCFDPAYANI